jgi:cobalt-precorrin-6B (C15)-methyltransferase
MLNSKWPFATAGIPDHMFARGKVPMTKEEVRVLTLSKLRINKDSVIWDIGAGTGSISIEAALIASAGHVYAIERHPQALAMIAANSSRFRAHNITIVDGTAPGALLPLPRPDRVVIGGSGGELSAIIAVVKNRLPPGGIVIVNCITIETLYKATSILKASGFESVEGVGITITQLRQTGNYHMLDGKNPVFIVSGIQV